MKKRGVTTGFWVVDTEEDMIVAMKLGADSVMTDRPIQAISYCDK